MDALVDSFRSNASIGGGDILEDIVNISSSDEKTASLSKLIASTQGEVTSSSGDDIVNFVNYLVQHVASTTNIMDETRKVDLAIGKLIIQLLNALKLSR